MDNNLANLASARITNSSEQFAYQGPNALNQSRSLVWKPAGNFEITALNNKIYINDGTNKTATLNINFFIYSQLADHIEEQLNAVSSNWTCTYSLTTRRFTIARSSGTKILRLTQTSAAVWDTIGFTGLVDQNAAAADEPRNHTDEWFQVDLVAAMDIQAFMAVGPIDLPFPVSESGTMRLQANNIDQWDSPPLDIELTRFDRGVFQFTDDIDDVAYRYVRFHFVDRTNPIGPAGFFFGCLYFGTYTTVLTSNVATGFNKKTVDPSIVSQTESGAEFFKSVPKYRSFDSFQIQNLEADERRELEQMFFDLGISRYFFFCLDPISEVTEDLDEATFYGRFEGEPQIQSVIRDIYTVNFSCREVV